MSGRIGTWFLFTVEIPSTWLINTLIQQIIEWVISQTSNDPIQPLPDNAVSNRNVFSFLFVLSKSMATQSRHYGDFSQHLNKGLRSGVFLFAFFFGFIWKNMKKCDRNYLRDLLDEVQF